MWRVYNNVMAFIKSVTDCESRELRLTISSFNNNVIVPPIFVLTAQKKLNYFLQNQKGHNTVFLTLIPTKLRNKSRDFVGISVKNTVL